MKITRFYRNTSLSARQLQRLVDCVSTCRRQDLGSNWRMDYQEYLLHYPPIVVKCNTVEEAIGIAESRGATTKHVTRLQTRSGRSLSLDTTDPFCIRLDVHNRSRSVELIERLEEILQLTPLPRCVLLTHGPGPLSAGVRSLLAKEEEFDLGVRELAYGALDEFARHLPRESDDCSYAVIVADDSIGASSLGAWLAYQIGYLQARYGLGRVCLVHAEGDQVPLNLDRLTYCAVPEDDRAPWALERLMRELRKVFPDPIRDNMTLLTTGEQLEIH